MEDVKRAAEPLHANTVQVVMGCLRALFEAVQVIQREGLQWFSQQLSVHAVLAGG